MPRAPYNLYKWINSVNSDSMAPQKRSNELYLCSEQVLYFGIDCSVIPYQMSQKKNTLTSTYRNIWLVLLDTTTFANDFLSAKNQIQGAKLFWPFWLKFGQPARHVTRNKINCGKLVAFYRICCCCCRFRAIVVHIYYSLLLSTSGNLIRALTDSLRPIRSLPLMNISQKCIFTGIGASEDNLSWIKQYLCIAE